MRRKFRQARVDGLNNNAQWGAVDADSLSHQLNVRVGVDRLALARAADGVPRTFRPLFVTFSTFL